MRQRTKAVVHTANPACPDLMPVARPYMPGADTVLPYLRCMDEVGWYSNFGPLLQTFEARLAARFPRPTALATVVNATQGLVLALQALGLEPGGFCALPSWTFVATAHAVVAAGLTPWFVDVDVETWMLEPDAVRDSLHAAPGPVTAVIPVSAFGRPVDVQAWATFRRETGIAVVVDAAAAFDSADAAPLPVVVSLHATKVLGVGEGGFVACEDADFIEDVRALTTFGFRGSRESLTPATNAKLSEYACAVGLAALDAWPSTRLVHLRAARALQMASLSDGRFRFQPGWGMRWISGVCVVEALNEDPERIIARMEARGLQTRQWWGQGCHRSPAFASQPRMSLPNTERLAAMTLGVPFWAGMTPDDIARVAEALTGD